MVSQSCFIYGLLDPMDNRIRYVGKAINPHKRFLVHLKDNGTTRKCRWIKKITALGYPPELTILEKLPSLDGWGEAERKWIKEYSKNDLTNLTDGGDGLSNVREETRKKMSNELKRRMTGPNFREKIFTKERGRKISVALTGIKHTKEHIAKLPQNQKGWHHTPETIAKIKLNSKGHRWSSEEIVDIRAMNLGNTYGVGNKSRTGQKRSKEELAKASIKLKGKPKTEEHKENIRKAALLRWAVKKGE
jgi:hypothetical protein